MPHALLGHGMPFDEPFICFGVLIVLALLAALPLAIVALVVAARASRRVREMREDLMAGAARRAWPPAPPRAEAPSRPVEGAARPPLEPPPAAPPLRPAVPPPVRPPPRPPVARPARPARPPGKPFRLEEAIGLKVLAWVGVAALLLATVLFIKYGYDRGWFGRRPWIRVAIPMAAGLALVAAGEVFQRRLWQALARVSTGGGIAALYYAAYVAWVRFDQPLLPEPAVWAFLAVVTAAAIVLAVRYSSLTVAIFSLVGGLAGPLLIHSRFALGDATTRDPGHTLMLYMVAVGGGVLAVAYFKKWRVLNLLALAAVCVNLSVWLVSHYRFFAAEAAREKLAFAVTYLTIFWLLFFLLSVVYHSPGRRDPSKLDLPVTVLNVVWYFGVMYALLEKDHHWVLGPLAVGLGAAYLGHGLAVQRLAPAHRPIILLQIAQALALLTLAIPIQLEGTWIPMAWAAEAAVLYWLGVRLKDWRVRAVGLLVHGASVVALLVFAEEAWAEGGWLVLNARTATFGAVAGAMALSAWLCRRVEGQSGAESAAAAVAAGLAHLVLMALVLVEVSKWHAVREAALRQAKAVPAGAYEHLHWAAASAAAVAMAAYGLAAAGAAVVLKRLLHHCLGMAAIAAALVCLGISLESAPAPEFLVGTSGVALVFALVAAGLALAAAVTHYGSGDVFWRRGFTIAYELLAIGALLALYEVELFRAADYLAAKDLGRLSDLTLRSLAAAGVVVVGGGTFLRGVWMRGLAHRVVGLAGLALGAMLLVQAVGGADHTYGTPVFNPRGVALAFLAGLLGAGAAAYARRPRDLAEAPGLGPVLLVAAHVAVLVLFACEAMDFWHWGEATRAARWLPNADRAADARHATLSVGYALYAFGLLAAGIGRRRAMLRLMGLVLLAVTIAKVFLYDLRKVEEIWRILSFLGLGLLVLAGSLLYHRYRRVLFRPEEEGPRAGKEDADGTS